MREAANHLASPLSARIQGCKLWISYCLKYHSDIADVIEAHSTLLELQELSLLFTQSLRAQRNRIIASESSKTAGQSISHVAALAIEHGHVTTAVELLDQSRAMVLSQLSRYRTALDELSDSDDPAARELAVRFTSLSRKLSTFTVSERDSQASSDVAVDSAHQTLDRYVGV